MAALRSTPRLPAELQRRLLGQVYQLILADPGRATERVGEDGPTAPTPSELHAPPAGECTAAILEHGERR